MCSSVNVGFLNRARFPIPVVIIVVCSGINILSGATELITAFFGRGVARLRFAA